VPGIDLRVAATQLGQPQAQLPDGDLDRDQLRGIRRSQTFGVNILPERAERLGLPHENAQLVVAKPEQVRGLHAIEERAAAFPDVAQQSPGNCPSRQFSRRRNHPLNTRRRFVAPLAELHGEAETGFAVEPRRGGHAHVRRAAVARVDAFERIE
jgi:hypothetical protein